MLHDCKAHCLTFVSISRLFYPKYNQWLNSTLETVYMNSLFNTQHFDYGKLFLFQRVKQVFVI